MFDAIDDVKFPYYLVYFKHAVDTILDDYVGDFHTI